MHEITVPIQLIDKQKCLNNIRRMLKKASISKAVLRPHFKTHQSLEVGQWFRDYGIDRIAVSSVTMAEKFASDNWKDILIAFPVNLREAHHINDLAKRIRLGLTISSPGVTSLLAESLNSKVDIYIKVDVGSHRTGFDPDDISLIEKELALAGKNPFMSFQGFVAHAGHTYQAASIPEVINIYNYGTEILKNLKEHFSEKHPGIIISWGDTPSCSIIPSFEGIDEIRPGNFVFYDLMQYNIGACAPEDISMVVAAPVVAIHPHRNELVVYAGAVHLSKEYIMLPDGRPCFGFVVSVNPGGKWTLLSHTLPVVRLSQEHGIISLPADAELDPEPGDLLGILPVHSCLAANLLKEQYRVV